MCDKLCQRKLTAILNADVDGYCRLVEGDEEGTIRTLSLYKELMARLIEEYSGRVVDCPGDNLLAEFPSVVNAVRCGIEIQREIGFHNANLSPDHRVEFRIGIHVGDVVTDGERILGDGVNLAARIQNLAHAGEVCVSASVYDLIKSALDVEFEDLGEKALKNVSKPVRVFRAKPFRGDHPLGHPTGQFQWRNGKDMRALIVEDDERIASFVAKGLRQAGFAVDVAGDGEEGLRLGLNEPYDVGIVDIMLPGMDGLSLIKELRRNKRRLPLLVLSAKRSVEDRVKGLRIGGDDYLVKPFSFSELLARVEALLRRSSSAEESGRLIIGDLSVDLITREVLRAGKRIELQPREFSLLEYLMRNAGRVVSKTMILEHVWDCNFDPQTNVVDVLVCRLRNKVDRDFEPKLIHTVRGVGYVLRPG